MAAKPATVEEYRATLAGDARARLEDVARIVGELAPEAVEGLSYGMVGYKYRGRPLLHFAAWKRHWALYGAGAAAHLELLAGYELSKGTIRFPIGEPVPEALLKTLIGERKAEIDAGG